MYLGGHPAVMICTDIYEGYGVDWWCAMHARSYLSIAHQQNVPWCEHHQCNTEVSSSVTAANLKPAHR
jgi:hypothetical protein